MEVVATAKWLRTTARKARLVAALVQGRPVSEALAILAFTPRAAAADVGKVIKSAAANAEHNYNLDPETLRVTRIEVEAAGMIKRFRPRAQGRAFSVFKRTSHVRVVVVDDVTPQVQPRRRGAASGAAAPRRTRRSGGTAQNVETTVATAAAPAQEAETE